MIPRAALLGLVAASLFLAACAEDPPRVLVIGLDGATFEKLDPLLESGKLPHLSALLARGSAGVLESTLPAVSPPAWTSAVTGVNPGKHDIYDFYRMTTHSASGILNTSRDRRARPVWHFLNDAGFRTGILNIPMTFPPDTVDGFFISGFPFGKNTTGYTHPGELEQDLQPYPLDPFGEILRAGAEHDFLLRLEHTFRRHAEEAVRLLHTEDWDLFWVVFTGIDKVQHFFWKYQDADHPDHDPHAAPELGDAIESFYVRADSVIGVMLAVAGEDVNVMVLSDHGFGPVYREARIWNWLTETGFLRPDPTGAGRHFVEAYPPGPFANALRVSVAGRDPGGRVPRGEASEVRERLVRELKRFVDPATGEPVALAVHEGRAVYHGAWVENAPDVLFVESPGIFAGRGTVDRGVFDAPLFGPVSYTFSGFHRPDGVMIAAGPDFAARAARGRYSILDVAPTVYWLFRMEAPADLDGRVPPGLVGEGALAARPSRAGELRAVISPEEAPPPVGPRETLETLGYVR